MLLPYTPAATDTTHCQKYHVVGEIAGVAANGELLGDVPVAKLCASPPSVC
jgi:hypothetical protein